VYKPEHARVRLNHCQRFGMRVRELRSEREITQEELAERVGVFRTYMSRIETGVANPTLTVIHALAESLGVAVPVLFEAPSAKVVAPTRSRQAASRGRVKK
jgi:transcriptional regulator with XRE-family HTH domain